MIHSSIQTVTPPHKEFMKHMETPPIFPFITYRSNLSTENASPHTCQPATEAV